MCIRERLGGEWRWTLNLVVHGVGGSLEPFGVGLWKNIKRGWENILSHTRFEVEGGSKIIFWHDQWCRDVALKDAFFDLFGISSVKDASVAAQLELYSGSIQCNVSLARAAHDWEVDVFALLFRHYI